MENTESASLIENACELLYRLGVTANLKGFFHVTYAVHLCAEQQDRLMLVTKLLYPDIARKYGTNWRAVERNIRTASTMAWRRNRPLLEALAQRPLDKPLKSAEFIELLLRTSVNTAADGQSVY